MDRRAFLKCAAAGVAVVSSAVAGYEFERWQTALVQPAVTTATVTETVTGPVSTVTKTRTMISGNLEIELFADWHGDGARQNDEPLVKDAILKVKGEGRDEIVQADDKGRHVLRGVIDGGRYHLDFAGFPAGRPYRFFSLPNGEFHPTADGYDFVSDLSRSTISVGLMNGFLTLPFAAGTHLDAGTGYPDIETAAGKWIDWRGKDATYDGHNGTDFIIKEGTSVLAAAPGVLRNIVDQPEHAHLWVEVEHAGGYWTTYSHLTECIVPAGTKVERGQYVGPSGAAVVCRSPSGTPVPCYSPHLHFAVCRGMWKDYLDPYRSLVPGKGSAESLWTKDNDPQYPLAS